MFCSPSTTVFETRCLSESDTSYSITADSDVSMTGRYLPFPTPRIFSDTRRQEYLGTRPPLDVRRVESSLHDRKPDLCVEPQEPSDVEIVIHAGYGG